MVPLWFTLSALCFVGAAVLLYVDIDRRRGRSRRRKTWARSHGFDFERQSHDIMKRWSRGVMSSVGHVDAYNVVLGQIRGEAVYIFDLEEVATVIALHRKVGTNVVVDLRLKGLKEPLENDIWLLGAIGPRMLYSTNLDAARRACDRRMVTFAHTAPECAEIMWNEQNWTLVALPVTSTRAAWDEGLRIVRQFNDLLRVLPPIPLETPADVPEEAAVDAAPQSPAPNPADRPESPQRTPVQAAAGIRPQAGLLPDATRRETEPLRREPIPVSRETEPIRREATAVPREAEPIRREPTPVPREAEPILRRDPGLINRETEPLRRHTSAVGADGEQPGHPGGGAHSADVQH